MIWEIVWKFAPLDKKEIFFRKLISAEIYVYRFKGQMGLKIIHHLNINLSYLFIYFKSTVDTQEFGLRLLQHYIKYAVIAK